MNVVGPLGEDADDVFDEALAGLALGDEDLDGELLHAAWQDGDRLDLGVVHLDDLAGKGAEPRAPQRHVLDDALELGADEEGDGVAHREPALGEHRQARDDVHEEPLRGEAAEDQQEGGAGDRGQPVDAARELADDDHGRNGEGHVGDPGADDADERLPPLQVGDRPGRLDVRVRMPAVMPGEDAPRRPGRRARDEPREREDGGDHDDASPRGGQRRVVVEQADGVVEH